MCYMVTPHVTSGNNSLAAPPVWNTAKIQEVINQKNKKGFEHLNYKVQSLWLLFLREFLRPNSELFIFRCDSKSLVFGFQTVEGGSTSGMHIYDDDDDVIANSYRQGGDK